MPKEITSFLINNMLFIILAVSSLFITIMNIMELITKKYDIHEEESAYFGRIKSKRVQSIVLVIYNSSLSIGIIAYLIYKYIYKNQTSTLLLLVFVFLLLFVPKLIVRVLNMLGKNNSDETTYINNNSESTVVNEDWDFYTDRTKTDKETQSITNDRED